MRPIRPNLPAVPARWLHARARRRSFCGPRTLFHPRHTVTSEFLPTLRVFDGLSQADVEQLFKRLACRTFGRGDVVVAEGDDLQEMYVVQTGNADVFVTDRDGTEHLVGRVGMGTTLGEMSLFTGQPAAATVRASSDLHVLVMTQDDLERIVTVFPRIYRNLAAMLSDR